MRRKDQRQSTGKHSEAHGGEVQMRRLISVSRVVKNSDVLLSLLVEKLGKAMAVSRGDAVDREVVISAVR